MTFEILRRLAVERANVSEEHNCTIMDKLDCGVPCKRLSSPSVVRDILATSWEDSRDSVP
jgi:hypothetical protein